MVDKRRLRRPPANLVSLVFAFCLLVACFHLPADTASAAWSVIKAHNVPQGKAASRHLASDDGHEHDPDGGTHSSSRELEASGHSSGGSDGHDHKSKSFNPMVFFLFTYTISAFSQQLQILMPSIMMHVPHTVFLFLIGMLAAFHQRKGTKGGDPADVEYYSMVDEFTDLDPHFIFWVLLPTLLFEDAAGADWHVVKRVMPNALLLAFPGVIINTVMTASGLMLWSEMTDKMVDVPKVWNWESSMLLGCILSATDPVAVVGALHSLQAPAKLSHLISGESLFNDGTAVALFQIFQDLTAGEEEWNLGKSVLKLLQLSLGGPALGLAVAIIAYMWLAHTSSSSIEIMVLLVAIFGTFFVAEHEKIHVSGVLAVVTLGFFMTSTAKFAIEVGNEHKHHAVIEFLAMLSNEAIFIVAGMISYRFMNDDSILAKDWLDLLFMYGLIHLTRSLVIIIFLPLLKRWGYGLTWKEALICIFGGLRGAVGLALGLLVIHNDGIDKSIRYKVAFHTSGIVFLTLVLNGSTVTFLYKWLRIASPLRVEYHEKILKAALEEADSRVLKRAAQLKSHWFLFNCNFDIIRELIPHLSDHVHFDEVDFYGRRKMSAKDADHVKKTMLALAQSQEWRHKAEENRFRLHDRYVAKVRFWRTGRSSNGNFFLFNDSIYQEERHQVLQVQEEIVQFSMMHVMKQRDYVKASQSEALQHDIRMHTTRLEDLALKATVNILILEANKLSETKKTQDGKGKERARLNWLIAGHLGRAVVGVWQEVRSQAIDFREIQEEAAWDEERLQEKLQKYPSKTSITGHSKASISREPTADPADRAETMKPEKSEKSLQMNKSDSQISHELASKLHISKKRIHAVPKAAKSTKAFFFAMTARLHDYMTGVEDGQYVMLEEVYQTIVNVTRAEYKAMFEYQTLHREAFGILMESAANEEEAIHGDFKKWVEAFEVAHVGTADCSKEALETPGMTQAPYFNGNIPKSETLSSKNLSAKQVDNGTLSQLQKDVKKQRISGFEVAMRYVSHILYRPRNEFANFLYWLFGASHSLYVEWVLLKRNVELLLAFLFTLEKVLEVVEDFELLKSKHVKKLIRTVRCKELYNLCDMHPSMFFLYEHLFYAHLILQYQSRIVHEMVEEGAISEEDAHHIEEHIIHPSDKAFRAYVPDRLTLKTVFFQNPKKKLTDKNDWLFKFSHIMSKGFKH